MKERIEGFGCKALLINKTVNNPAILLLPNMQLLPFENSADKHNK